MGNTVDKFNYLIETKQAIKQAIIDKGVEVTDTDTFRSYADKVGEISGGSGDILGVPYIIENGVVSFPSEEFEYTLPLTIEDLPTNALYYKFSMPYSSDNIKVTKISMPNLKKVSSSYACGYMCYLNKNVIAVDLSKLEEVSGFCAFSFAFQDTGTISTVDLDNLKTVSGACALQRIFYNSQISELKISKLEKVTGRSAFFLAFGKNKLSIVRFESLSEVSGQGCFNDAFSYGTTTHIYFSALTENSFGSYTDQFNDMLASVTGCTVHFPSNLESTIGTWEDVVAGFGGTNTVVLFDLPAT